MFVHLECAIIIGVILYFWGNKMAQYTPMIQQYLTVKADYQDAFLFFRLGDFYEMFFEDAIKASKELEITLTSRLGGTEERIPMCGVPYHSAQNYIYQLIEKGYKVAICEQTEDAKLAKGVVKREVVQLITPGTIMEGNIINEKENNFIATVTNFEDGTYGIGSIDLTTGESKVTLLNGDWNDCVGEIYSLQAKEIVLSSSMNEDAVNQLRERLGLTVSIEDSVTIPNEFKDKLNVLEQSKLQTTMARLLHYLLRTQKRSIDHIQNIQYYRVHEFMKLDLFSKRNLELIETIRTKGRKGSLLWLLDKTSTAMGGRLLKQWIERPLLEEKEINKRLDMVQTLINQFFEREELREQLKEVYDLERLAGKISFGNVNAKDLVQLRKSLTKVPEIIDTVKKLEHAFAKNLAEDIDPCADLVNILQSSIKENPPLTIKDGDIIKDGYSETLDRYRDASRNGKRWIAELEKHEKDTTGIRSLKIGYNKVFGYYIEVTKANLHLIPEGRYERKQTLTNAERFITPELKEKETLILEAEEKIVDLEHHLFLEIREQSKQYIPKLQKVAKQISELDALQCFATVSEEYHYTRPHFTTDRSMFIKDGRHPVVEKVMNSQEYVPNDCDMNIDREVLLITGPNMSGKSTFMRQIALTSILAQIGCFVPASEAAMPIFDQIFTRIGAADDLVSGQSTFMVEMIEANNAVSKATKDSLILLDEIGRGTSTYDGMALAQAIVEYIHHEIGAKTLFSTHYHELTILESSLSSLKNVHVSAIEEKGKVVFLHKVKEGYADKSYGIHVAELAQLPPNLINRAKEILDKLESSKQSEDKVATSIQVNDQEQLSFFVSEQKQKLQKEEKLSNYEKEVLSRLKSLDLLEMTPLEAMNELYSLHKTIKSKL